MKLRRLGLARVFFSLREAPRGALILDPPGRRALHSWLQGAGRGGAVGVQVGPIFLELNKELLEAYSEAEDSSGVLAVQEEALKELLQSGDN